MCSLRQLDPQDIQRQEPNTDGYYMPDALPEVQQPAALSESMLPKGPVAAQGLNSPKNGNKQRPKSALKNRGPAGNADAAGGGVVTGVARDVTDESESSWLGCLSRETAELLELPLPTDGKTVSSWRQYTFMTGAVYEGEWRGNARHGFGSQRWPEGAKYEGEWSMNVASGLGRFQHHDGDLYCGQWHSNMAHGYGVYVHRDGTTYAGQFVEDLQHGIGMESWPDGSNFLGQFVEGKKTGDGVYEWPDGSSYRGQWISNQIDGFGSYHGFDKRTYRGCWQTSAMHGCGKYEWADGRCFQGQYFCDQKDGFGLFLWADGRRYEGYWCGGVQHGLGRLSDNTGASRLAQWSYGKRVGWCEQVCINLEKRADRKQVEIVESDEA